YGFLQTPPLASDALAIRIVFPLVRVTPFSFKWTGLPALLGKQRQEPHIVALLLFLSASSQLTNPQQKSVHSLLVISCSAFATSTPPR
ncbi:hypothetical protein D8T36_18690, partial [Vibrio vulnificus]